MPAVSGQTIMAITEAQKRAKAKWREKNREKVARQTNKAVAKMYIKSATIEEIEEIQKWIKERKIMKKYTVNGTEYELQITQDAYLTGTNDHPVYEGTATDKEGVEYLVTWEIKDDYDPMAGEENACDWGSPVKVQRLY